MAFLQANIFSNVLQMEVMVNVILPQKTEKAFGTNQAGKTEDIPVVYLLHGMHGNHSVWQRRTSIERYVADKGLAVIMPSTDLGWYTDTTFGMNYWTFISEELPAICQELFPQLTRKREKTYAVGLSMGGYGALKLGMRCPEKFGAIASLSGALALAEMLEQFEELPNPAYWTGIFGDVHQFRGSENDPIHLIQQVDVAQAPRVFVCVGTQDPLYPASQYAVQKMKEKGIAVTYEEGPGVHNWEFWDHWIQRVLEWLVE